MMHETNRLGYIEIIDVITKNYEFVDIKLDNSDPKI